MKRAIKGVVSLMSLMSLPNSSMLLMRQSVTISGNHLQSVAITASRTARCSLAHWLNHAGRP